MTREAFAKLVATAIHVSIGPSEHRNDMSAIMAHDAALRAEIERLTRERDNWKSIANSINTVINNSIESDKVVSPAGQAGGRSMSEATRYCLKYDMLQRRYKPVPDLPRPTHPGESFEVVLSVAYDALVQECEALTNELKTAQANLKMWKGQMQQIMELLGDPEHNIGWEPSIKSLQQQLAASQAILSRLDHELAAKHPVYTLGVLQRIKGVA